MRDEIKKVYKIRLGVLIYLKLSCFLKMVIKDFKVEVFDYNCILGRYFQQKGGGRRGMERRD